MPTARKAFIASTLRKRIERSLQTRAMAPGDRLPSTREVGNELGADPRVVMAAYRVLAEEGLVVLRPRSGAFIAPVTDLTGEDRLPPTDHLVDVLVGGVVRGFSLRSFTDSLRTAAFARRLRVVVVAGSADQVHGLCRELRADYGLEAHGLLAEQVKAGSKLPQVVERAHLLLTTKGFGAEVSRLGTELDKPVIVANVRPAGVSEEWQGLLRAGRVYLVALDPRFLALAQSYLQSTPDSENIRMLLVGRDDLLSIPPLSPTYVTEAARQKIGKMRVPGQLIAPTRLFAEDCVRAITRFIVGANMLQEA